MVRVNAGPVRADFYPEDLFLRSISYQDQEILRGIYAAVRDEGWGTVLPEVSDLQVHTTKDTFEIAFVASCESDSVDFVWHGKMVGGCDGTIRFDFSGNAYKTFSRNRIGFCVLHPPICAGKSCILEKSNGCLEKSVFPDYIAPHQPFLDLQAITYKHSSGIDVKVEFSGDTFETEDQRNWTDASFKTYCTPLAKPFPVKVEAGTSITQSVVLSIIGHKPDEVVSVKNQQHVQVDIAQPVGSFPPLGFGLPRQLELLDKNVTQAIRKLQPRHLRVDVCFDTKNWRSELLAAIKVVQDTDSSLELALFLTDNALQELTSLSGMLDRTQVARVLVFHVNEVTTKSRWIKLAKDILSNNLKPLVIGGGTDEYFTELNRNRPSLAEEEYISYSLNPQVHAFDDLSIMETLQGQKATMTSALQIVNPKPVIVSPVTLKPRFNPHLRKHNGEISSVVNRTDERQALPFTASWTLGSISSLAYSGASSLTFYETHGACGLMEEDQGLMRFFPVYSLFQELLSQKSCQMLGFHVSDECSIAVIGLEQPNGKRKIFLGNKTDRIQLIKVTCPGLQEAQVKKHLRLTLQHSDQAIELGLLPYEYACVNEL